MGMKYTNYIQNYTKYMQIIFLRDTGNEELLILLF